jgi:hypothetical protein
MSATLCALLSLRRVRCSLLLLRSLALCSHYYSLTSSLKKQLAAAAIDTWQHTMTSIAARHYYTLHHFAQLMLREYQFAQLQHVLRSHT